MRSASPVLFEAIHVEMEGVERRLADAASLDHPLLRSVLQDVLLAPGKRFRPALALASGRMFGAPGPTVEAIAAAVELLHTATLIHDDVVDLAGSRRGEPTLHVVLGNRIALLVGDYLFAKAAATAAETDDTRIMHRFAESVMAICAGQIEECTRSLEMRPCLEPEEYYRTIEAKTAELFVFACQAGAILGGASAEHQAALASYARSLGLAFQIVDDILDLVGSESELGKPSGSDLRQGVMTLPLIYLRENIPELLLAQAFSEDGAREQAIRSIGSIAGGSRALERAYVEARTWAARARQALASLPQGRYRELLEELTHAVIERSA